MRYWLYDWDYYQRAKIPKFEIFDIVPMCKIDSSHQSVLTMILKNPTLVMVGIENKVDASFEIKKDWDY